MLSDIQGARAVFMLAKPALRPGVLDGENKNLTEFTRWAWYAYQLSLPRIAARDARPWIFSGEAEMGRIPSEIRPVNAKSFEILPELFYPHMGDHGYQLLTDHGWPDRMASIYDATINALDAKNELPPVVDAAMVAYSNALRVAYVDLRVPFFVRSAECILALPKRTGATEFAARGALSLKGLMDQFLGDVPLPTILKKIFWLRNDCVHGKVVKDELTQRGEVANAARYQYLAMILAQRTTEWAIRHHALLRQFRTRAELEAAWVTGQIGV